MAALSPEIVFRKWATDGVPDSGPWNPKKDEIIELLDMLFGRIKDVPSATDAEFGAKGDGATNDTAALQAFFNNSTKTGILPGAIFRTTGAVDIPTGFTLFSYGATIYSATAGIARLRSIDTDNVSILGKLNLTGAGKANSTGAGLLLGGNNRCRIENVHCLDIDGYGIRVNGGTYDPLRGDKTQFVTCSAVDCWTGYRDEPNITGEFQNEYATHIGFHVTGCQVGVDASVGNTSFVGGKIVDNDRGYYGRPSNNAAHGTITGVQINHNSVSNVEVEGDSAGLLFVGCTFYGDDASHGVFRVVNSRGIQIVGGMLECSVYCDGAASHVMIIGCYNSKNFTPLFAGTHPQNIYRFNNIDRDFRPVWDDEGWDYVNVYRGASAQALTSGAEARVIFNSLQRKNTRLSYSLTTGAYTVPTAGFFRFTTQIKVSGTTPAGYITLKKNGTAVAFGALSLVAGFGIGSIVADIDCAVGDVLEVTVTATGTGIAVAINPGSYLQILGL